MRVILDKQNKTAAEGSWGLMNASFDWTMVHQLWENAPIPEL